MNIKNFIHKFFFATEEDQYKDGWDWAKGEIYGSTADKFHLRCDYVEAHTDSSPDRSKFDDGALAFVNYARATMVTSSVEQLTKVAELNAAAQIRIMLLDKIGNEETTYTEVDDLICDWIHERMNRGSKVDY